MANRLAKEWANVKLLQFPTCWPIKGLFVHWSRGWGVLSFSERLVVLVQISKYTPTYGWLVSTCFPTVLPWSIFCWKQLRRIYLKWPPEVCDFHYSVCVCAYIAEALVLVSCMVTQKFKFGNNTYRWNVGFFTVKMLFWQWMKHITSTKH